MLEGAGDGWSVGGRWLGADCRPCVGCCVLEPPWDGADDELGDGSGIGRSDWLGVVESCGPGAGESCGGAVGNSVGCCSVAPDWLGIGWA